MSIRRRYKVLPLPPKPERKGVAVTPWLWSNEGLAIWAEDRAVEIERKRPEVVTEREEIDPRLVGAVTEYRAYKEIARRLRRLSE